MLIKWDKLRPDEPLGSYADSACTENDQACVPKVAQSLTLGERNLQSLKTTWIQTVMAELSEEELQQIEAQHAAQNRANWRDIVGALYPTRDEKERVSKERIRRGFVISSTQRKGTGLPTTVR